MPIVMHNASTTCTSPSCPVCPYPEVRHEAGWLCFDPRCPACPYAQWQDGRSSPWIAWLHRYEPPLRYVDRIEWTHATWFDGTRAGPDIARLSSRVIHCGPPAHLPAAPTPEDIERAAEGLGRVMLR